MRRSAILVSAFILALSSGAFTEPQAAASPSPGGDWKQYGYDSAHSSYNASETTLTASSVASLHLLWAKGPAGPDVIEHGHVIACAVTCYSRLDINGGLYRTYTIYKRTGIIAVGEGRLFTEGFPEELVYGVPLSGGAGGWAQFFSNYQIGGPVYHAGRLFSSEFHGPAGHVHALDAATGAKVWSTVSRSTDGFWAPPTVAFNRVYIPGPTSLQAFREDNGRFRWLLPIDSPDQVIAGRNLLYVNSFEGITALDPINGQRRWNVPNVFGSLAVDDNTVYVAQSGNVTALDAATGALRWQTPVSANYITPTIAGGLVWTSNGGTLTALHTTDGTTAWSNADHRYGGQAIVGDGVLAVGCDAPVSGGGVCVFGL